MSTGLPNLPWKKVATVLFYWKASTYLLIFDYYSEINKLNGQSSEIISHKIEAWILQEVVFDKRPPYSSH